MDTKENTNEKIAYSVNEVAKLLGISPATCYEHCTRGTLPTIKFGRRILIPKAAFDRFLNAKLEVFEQRMKAANAES